MKLVRTLGLLLLALPLAACPALAIPVPREAAETPVARVTAGLDDAAPMPALVAAVAARFVGKPYGAQGYSPREGLACELDAFDCVTLVEASMAIARSLAAGEPTQRAYVRELASLRFRDGKPDGFASRLHYFSDWIGHHTAAGRLEDVTAELGGEPDTRSIDYMTRNWEKYQKVKVEADFAAMRKVEQALSASKRHWLPKAKVAGIVDRLQSGDILAIVTNIEGLDVVHVGLAYRKPDGVMHLLHAPVPGDVVSVSSKPLVDYLKVYDAHTGVIVARPLPPERPWWKPFWPL